MIKEIFEKTKLFFAIAKVLIESLIIIAGYPSAFFAAEFFLVPILLSLTPFTPFNLILILALFFFIAVFFNTLLKNKNQDIFYCLIILYIPYNCLFFVINLLHLVALFSFVTHTPWAVVVLAILAECLLIFFAYVACFFLTMWLDYYRDTKRIRNALSILRFTKKNNKPLASAFNVKNSQLMQKLADLFTPEIKNIETAEKALKEPAEKDLTRATVSLVKFYCEVRWYINNNAYRYYQHTEEKMIIKNYIEYQALKADPPLSKETIEEKIYEKLCKAFLYNNNNRYSTEEEIYFLAKTLTDCFFPEQKIIKQKAMIAFIAGLHIGKKETKASQANLLTPDKPLPITAFGKDCLFDRNMLGIISKFLPEEKEQGTKRAEHPYQPTSSAARHGDAKARVSSPRRALIFDRAERVSKIRQRRRAS